MYLAHARQALLMLVKHCCAYLAHDHHDLASVVITVIKTFIIGVVIIITITVIVSIIIRIAIIIIYAYAYLMSESIRV